MNKKIIIIFTGVLLGLLLLLFLKEKTVNMPGRQIFRGTGIKEIEIREPGGNTLKLKKMGNRWFAGVWPANENTVENAITSIKDIRLEETISSRVEMYQNFEVSLQNGLAVDVYSEKDKKTTIYVGKRGPEWIKNFIRIEGDPFVYLAPVSKELFSVNIDSWRENRIFRHDLNELEAVKFKFKDVNFSVSKDTSSWDNFINKMQDMCAIEFIEDVEKYKRNFEAPFADMEFILSGNKSKRYTVIKDNENYFVKPPDLELIYHISLDTVSKIKEIKNNYCK